MRKFRLYFYGVLPYYTEGLSIIGRKGAMSTHSKGKASEMKHYAGKAVFSAAVGHALDGLDLMILSFALSGIMATFAVDNTTAGMLTSITLAGAFRGGLIFGNFA